ncbi:uncharacterized protein CTRU02_201329 [Colletotrichum truncatum]|uniref:Uncharacterized protein n=1 Tax=Colletotrichum truncatum TaxID=5467 RepID=A0ACC3ZH09_COLTU
MQQYNHQRNFPNPDTRQAVVLRAALPQQPPPPHIQARPNVTAIQRYPVPVAGPWSAWTLDDEGRGFYFRNRIGFSGEMEWDFSPPQSSHCYQASQAVVPVPRGWHRSSLDTRIQPGYHHSSRHPGIAAQSRYNVDSRAIMTQNAGYPDCTKPRTSGPRIPAIIDVNSQSIKVKLPNHKSGGTTLIWDRKPGRSRKSKSTPNSRVVEWLQSDFGGS